MPRYDPPASLSVGIDGFLAPDISLVSLEDSASEHSGRFMGGLLTINKVIHDVSPYGNVNTSFDLFDNATRNWKFVITGAFMWGTITWASAAPTIRMGHVLDTDAILVDWAPASGVKEKWGLLHAHYGVPFGIAPAVVLEPADGDIRVTWSAGTSGAISGNVSFSFWGFAIPNLEDATS